MNMYDVVDTIEMNGRLISIYNSPDYPMFDLEDIASIFETKYSMVTLLSMCDPECIKVVIFAPKTRDAEPLRMTFINEMGLYTILAATDSPYSRKWRSVMASELVRLRRFLYKEEFKDVYETWEHELDTLYYDPNTKALMKMVTRSGGDGDSEPVEPV